jgi:hypothetical protein
MIAKGGACDVTDWAEREWNPAVAEVWDAATAALAAIRKGTPPNE